MSSQEVAVRELTGRAAIKVRELTALPLAERDLGMGSESSVVSAHGTIMRLNEVPGLIGLPCAPGSYVTHAFVAVDGHAQAAAGSRGRR